MSFVVTQTWTNNNPKTIYNVLKAKLNREPTREELITEVKRILSDK